MPKVRSFLAGAMDERVVREGARDLPAPMSSNATPDARAIVHEEEPAKSPPKDKGEAIKLSSRSDTNLPRGNDVVAESGPIVEQCVEVEVGPVVEGGQVDDGKAEHTTPVDRALKGPRIDEDASGSKSSPHIILASSNYLQEVLPLFLLLFSKKK